MTDEKNRTTNGGDLSKRVSDALDGAIGRAWRTAMPTFAVALLIYGITLLSGYSQSITALQVGFGNFSAQWMEWKTASAAKFNLVDQMNGEIEALKAAEAERDKRLDNLDAVIRPLGNGVRK